MPSGKKSGTFFVRITSGVKKLISSNKNCLKPVRTEKAETKPCSRLEEKETKKSTGPSSNLSSFSIAPKDTTKKLVRSRSFDLKLPPDVNVSENPGTRKRSSSLNQLNVQLSCNLQENLEPAKSLSTEDPVISCSSEQQISSMLHSLDIKDSVDQPSNIEQQTDARITTEPPPPVNQSLIMALLELNRKNPFGLIMLLQLYNANPSLIDKQLQDPDTAVSLFQELSNITQTELAEQLPQLPDETLTVQETSQMTKVAVPAVNLRQFRIPCLIPGSTLSVGGQPTDRNPMLSSIQSLIENNP